jgi:hypothetical protein
VPQRIRANAFSLQKINELRILVQIGTRLEESLQPVHVFIGANTVAATARPRSDGDEMML